MKLEFFGKVDDGRLHIYNRNAFVSLLKNFDGKEIKIIIERKKKTRSNPQNRYYWGCIIPAIQQGLFETQGEWINANEVHEFLKQNFNYKELVNDNTGEVLRLGLTTTDKGTIEFEEYLDRCRQFADEFLNVIIPLPNEQANLCEDRCHRIGQKDSVQVSYFLGNDTIDQHIYDIIEKKRVVANEITGTEDSVQREIIDKIKNLFN